MLDLMVDKTHDETRQGEAYMPDQPAADTHNKSFYIESYGCCHELPDTEVIASILQSEGYGATHVAEKADLILVNTCSIREKAEQTVRNRLQVFRQIKQKTRFADRRSRLYGRKAENKPAGRRKTGRHGGGPRRLPQPPFP